MSCVRGGGGVGTHRNPPTTPPPPPTHPPTHTRTHRPSYAREHEPCIIFMDEIDAIGGKRFSEGTSADREVQRTLMELLAQVGGRVVGI